MPNRANHNREHAALIVDLVLAINQRYMPRCMVWNLNVIKAQRGHGWSRSAPNGAADIVGCIESSACALECKTGQGKLSALQRDFQAAWTKAGGVHIVAREVDTAMLDLDKALHRRPRPIDALPRDVEAMAKYLRPDVVRIRYTVGEDWHGDPAIHFRVLLSDAAAQRPCLLATTTVVETEMREAIDFTAMGLLDYYSYRSVTEQAALKCKEWD